MQNFLIPRHSYLVTLFILSVLLLAACGVGASGSPAALPTGGEPASLSGSPPETAPGKQVTPGAPGLAGAPATAAAPTAIVEAPTPTSLSAPLAAAVQPTPQPVLRPLTGGGCCSQPNWSPDGQWVLYIDKPSPEAPSGLWRVARAGGAPEFYTDRLGVFSPDFQLRAFPQSGQAVVERLSDGQRWGIPSSGRSVSFSPDSLQVAWSVGRDSPPFDTAQREIWISQVDGSQARKALSISGGSFSGWLSPGKLLISQRLEAPESGQIYWAYTIGAADSLPPQGVELGRGGRLRGAAASPDGEWLVYMATFSDDPNLDGLWLANTRSGARIRLGLFGAYQWRDSQRLLIVPLDLTQPVHRLWQVEVSSGQALLLTDPAITPFKIANGDWRVSPDGQAVAFVSADDQNIWILELP